MIMVRLVAQQCAIFLLGVHMSLNYIKRTNIRVDSIIDVSIIDVSMGSTPWRAPSEGDNRITDLVFFLRLLGLNGQVCKFSVVYK